MPEAQEHLKQFPSPALTALTFYKQFVIYKLVPSTARPGKTDKLPVDYRTGAVVSAHDPAYWTDAETAKRAALQWGVGYGIGFVFTEQDPFFFLDMDNCRGGDGWSPLAQNLCRLLSGAAVEVSQSGEGLHCIGMYTGAMPAHGCRNQALGLELYHAGRFVALTGINAVGNAAADMTAMLPALVSTYFPPDAATTAGVAQEWTTSAVSEWFGPSDDAELIRRAMQSKSVASTFGNRAGFADLWFADEAALGKAYPDANGRAYDASAADAALAQHLSFWAGSNCERISRLMKQSALMREKYDRPDYLPRTILGAVGRQLEVLQDRRPESTLAGLAPSLTVPSGTPDELTPEDFYAYLPDHRYINRRTREFFSADAVNGHLRRFTHSLGMKPSQWLDMLRAVQQMSWQPAHPEIIEAMRSENGQLVPEPKGRIYNLYQPSDAVGSDDDPSPWVNHVRGLYPDDADHIIKCFAYRIQNPGEKINHALVIGGSQGIGKDLMIEPLRYGVGRSNFADVNPGDLFKDFNVWVESTLLIINEARDLGDADRYKFYESSKRFIAAPPGTLSCNRKHLAAYDVPNVMAVIITTNNKLSGLYLEPDDRRHYVAWSVADKQPAAYFKNLWKWLDEGGRQAVVGYLWRLDISYFDPKAEPPKTEAWRQIVAANANPEETALADALEDAQGTMLQIATVREIIAAAHFRGHIDLATGLMDKKNGRKIPHLLERIGFEALQNPNAKSDGRWRFGDGRKETLYVSRKLPRAEQLKLANDKLLAGTSKPLGPAVLQ